LGSEPMVQGFGFGAYGSGFRVLVSGFEFRDLGLGFLEFRV